MKSVTVHEAKTHLSRLLNRVEEGEEIEIRRGSEPLDVTIRHVEAAGALSGAHRDPFDRMLIAQSRLEGLDIVSNEKLFDDYGVTRVW